MFRLALVTALLLAGCGPDQAQRPERPLEGTRSAVQASPWVDPACYVEGPLVALECNELGAWPWCPSEDAAQHDGEPCFWQDPNGLGLLWSDGRR